MHCFLLILCLFSTVFCLENVDERFSAILAPWIEQFREKSTAIFDHLTKGPGKGTAFDWLAEICDDFGHRQVGSRALEEAIDFNVKRLNKNGFDNVHTEKVPDLPGWNRGKNTVQLIEPRRQLLHILAVEGSPSADLTAPVIVLDSFDQLIQLSENDTIRGKIVLFVEKWDGYKNTVKYRQSVDQVQKTGAVGLLIKSVSPFSLYSPHTGSGARGAEIPTACITIEEAEMLLRLQKRGKKLVIRMNFTSSQTKNVTSRNTIFELTGTEKPNEIVLLSGHFDSWDVGQGALDDGGGCAIMWSVLNTLKKLGLRPKRTIRVLFWTAEEQGYFGSKFHHEHSGANSNETFFFVSESDNGAFRPQNWKSKMTVTGSSIERNILADVLLLINSMKVPLSLETVDANDQGDVNFWAANGVPSAYYIADQGKDYYFYFHHTDADYMTVFKEGDLEYSAAIFAIMAHVLANMDDWCDHRGRVNCFDTDAAVDYTLSSTLLIVALFLAMRHFSLNKLHLY